MLINTTTRHCELDPEDRLHAHQRLEKLQRYARDLHEAHLIVSAEKYRHTAEITLKLKHHEMVSREESTGARMAIDRAADVLEEQLRRLKDRRLDRKQRPGELPAAAGDGADTGIEDESGEEFA